MWQRHPSGTSGRWPGLGEELLAAVEHTVQVIASNPEAFPLVHRDARRALLSRFPSALYYRLGPEYVIVVGCFHAKRNPRTWHSRR